MMKKSTIAAAMLLALTANVYAADEGEGEGSTGTPNQGHGTVEFVGAIIDAPCSISPESADQTVDMGQIANKTLEVYGEGAPQSFDIKLEGCVIDTAKSVGVKFKGISHDGSDTQLALEGLAKGAAIEMMNASTGDTITLGQETMFEDLVDGTNILKFSAKLVNVAAKADEIVPGDFRATTDFVLAYQ